MFFVQSLAWKSTSNRNNPDGGVQWKQGSHNRTSPSPPTQELCEREDPACTDGSYSQASVWQRGDGTGKGMLLRADVRSAVSTIAKEVSHDGSQAIDEKLCELLQIPDITPGATPSVAAVNTAKS